MFVAALIVLLQEDAKDGRACAAGDVMVLWAHSSSSHIESLILMAEYTSEDLERYDFVLSETCSRCRVRCCAIDAAGKNLRTMCH